MSSTLLARQLKSLDAVNHKLIDAAKAGREEGVREALQNPKVVVDYNDYPESSTSLLFSCEGGHSSCVKLLVEAKANVNHANSSGMCAPQPRPLSNARLVCPHELSFSQFFAYTWQHPADGG